MESARELEDIVRSRFSEMIADLDGVAEEIRNSSYRHPNGFWKIVFPSDDPSYEELRIHFWEEHSLGWSDIHDHTSDFISIVSTGVLEEEFWNDDAGGLRLHEYQCSPKGGDDVVKLTRVGYRTASPSGRIVRAAGSSVRIDRDKFHRVRRAALAPAVSIVAQFAKVRAHSIVLSTSQENNRIVPAPRPTRAEFLAMIGTLRELLRW